MNARSTAQRDTAKRLLQRGRVAAFPSSRGRRCECADAAARVYQDIFARLAPLIGAAGVRALVARSARLAMSERPYSSFLSALGDTGEMDDQGSRLVECLRGQDEATATEATIVLFATFLDLLSRFIGEGLTARVVGCDRPEPAASAHEEEEQ